MEKIPLDILRIIASFIVPKRFELDPRVDESKLNPQFLSINPCQKMIETVVTKKNAELSRLNFFLLSKNPLDMVVEFLLQNQYWVDFDHFSTNSNDTAVNFLLNNEQKIDWYGFSQNTNETAVKYLINNPSKIDWSSFSRNNNEKAVDYMLSTEETRKFINYKSLCENTNQKALEHLIKSHNENQTEICTKTLVINKNDTAVAYIFKIFENLNDREKTLFFEEHYYIFFNSNDKIVDYFIKNPQYIKWVYFLRNTSHKAIEFMTLSKNETFINWNILSTNPSIFIEKQDDTKIFEYALSML